MSLPLVPFALCAVLIAAGVTLLLERSLVRILIGVIVLSNGVNLLIVTAGGPAGRPPFTGTEGMADPLPQAMVLTSIVITLGVTAFLLAMAHRSWQLTGDDAVQDDTEDRRVRIRATAGELSRGLRDREKSYERLVADQRAELARLDAERIERERRAAAELESRILEINVDLGRWMEAHKNDGLTSEELLRRFEEARQQEEAQARGKDDRVRALRDDFARRQREQDAAEQELRRKLRTRQREARRKLRAAIREDLRRQALAQDPELEGED
ncbi:Na(+)/H(+) antiporter subunit C [Nonomuraea sp. NPDC059023]|uniref:Na(+)/H(+) antiporter subunit C n=1 Tax=unclassified Nonomuraea TaxID=2593643 RepID=UPI0036B1577F